MANTQPLRIKTISEYHQVMGLPKPHHPLISLINYKDIKRPPEEHQTSFSLMFDCYCISLKRSFNAKFKYGQQSCDFNEGLLFFMSPGQLFAIEKEPGKILSPMGWMLLIHPDFLWNTSLAKNIKQYEYFSYSVHEALFLSDKEETTIINILQNIEQEYQSNIDKFSQDVIIAQLELLFTYSERFYQRQFITRKTINHQILYRLEDLLATCFNSDDLRRKGLPSVQYTLPNH